MVRVKILVSVLVLLLAGCGGESMPSVDAAAQVATTSATVIDAPTTTAHDEGAEATNSDENHMDDAATDEHMDDEDHATDEHADDMADTDHATDEHADDMADMDHSTMSVDLADEGAVADRTIEVVMAEFSFDPGPIDIAAGETVEFVVHNEGVIQHEFRVTTMETIEHHVAEGHGDHSDGMEPGVMLVDPGQSGSMLVTFHEAGEFDMIACLIPGHYEAEMATELNIDG